MRVPVSLAARLRPIEMPLEELATRLSVSTAEVEGIERRGVDDAGGNLDLFRVGRVLEAEKHPNADRLQLTKVDVGEREPRVDRLRRVELRRRRDRRRSRCPARCCRTASRSSGARCAARSPTG